MMNYFDELKRLADIAKNAENKAEILSRLFWDADEGKIPCSDEEYASIEKEYNEALRDEQLTFMACFNYIDQVTTKMDNSAFRLGLPYEARSKIIDTTREALTKWLEDEYGLTE